MVKKSMSVVTAVLIMLLCAVSAFSVSADEQDNIQILVIGDSISTGYGLSSSSTESFSAIIKTEKGFSVNNKAVNGNTASGIKAQFNSNAITDSDIQSANVVTITCGGNDLMALLYNKIVDIWNKQNPDDIIDEKNIADQLLNASVTKRIKLMKTALKLLDSSDEMYLFDDEEFLSAINQYTQNLNEITAHIHEKNENAIIIVATQYNPYKSFKNAKYSGLVDLNPLYSGMEAGATALSNAIVENASVGGYYVADVKDAFDKSTDVNLCNAYCKGTDLNIDFHPNARGHKVIADTFIKVMDEIILSITFDSNGGNGTMEPQIFAKNTNRELNPNTFNKEGYIFIGWNTSPDGSGENYSEGESVTFGKDTKLYAQWKQQENVSSSAEDSEDESSDTNNGTVIAVLLTSVGAGVCAFAIKRKKDSETK